MARAPCMNRAQIAISALGDAAKNRAITGRHLLRHQTKPCSEITPFRKGGPVADRSYHRAGNDRPMPGTVINRRQFSSARAMARSILLWCTTQHSYSDVVGCDPRAEGAHEATRVHHAARRRCGDVAARRDGRSSQRCRSSDSSTGHRQENLRTWQPHFGRASAKLRYTYRGRRFLVWCAAAPPLPAAGSPKELILRAGGDPTAVHHEFVGTRHDLHDGLAVMQRGRRPQTRRHLT